MLTPSITFSNRNDLLIGKETSVTLELPFSKSDYENMLKALSGRSDVTGKENIIITHYTSSDPLTKELMMKDPNIYGLNAFHRLYNNKGNFGTLFEFRDDIINLYKDYRAITTFDYFLDILHPGNINDMFNVIFERCDEGLATHYIEDCFFDDIYYDLDNYQNMFDMDKLLTKYVTYLGKEILIEKDIFDDDEFREVLYEHLSKDGEFLQNVNIDDCIDIGSAIEAIYQRYAIIKKEDYYVVMENSEYYSWSEEEKRELSGL